MVCGVATEDPPTNLVTTTEAARALGIDRTTLWRWHEKGMVTPAYVSPGGHPRWSVEDLREQLNRNRGRRGDLK
jgi:DNA-binding transcriptional MerR regulator